MPIEDPFTQEDLAQMKVGLSKLGDAGVLIKKAKSADIDMSSQETRTKDLRTQLTKLMQVYFPGQ